MGSSGDRLDTLLDKLTLSLGADNATITVSPTIALVAVTIIAANPNRKGLILYNNSANSVYVAFGSGANSNTKMTIIIPTFAHWIMPTPVYRGIITGIRNAGTGTVIATELV